MEDFPNAVHVSVPFFMLRDQYLPLVLENRISLEIGIDAGVLDTCPLADLTRVAEVLQREGLSCSLHAPFLDLSPGAMDPKIRRVSRERLEEVLRLIPVFRPRWIVTHAAYEARHYADSPEAWLANCVDTFSGLLSRMEGLQVPLMVENVFEKDPSPLEALFQSQSHPGFRFCLDAGHHRIYGQSDLTFWIDRLGPWLGLLHLHDNHGFQDDHLALGQGCVDFPGLFEQLRSRNLMPFITIEPHQEAWVRESLTYLSRHWPCS